MNELPKDFHLLQHGVLAGGYVCESRSGMEQRAVLAEADLDAEIRRVKRSIAHLEEMISRWNKSAGENVKEQATGDTGR
jgi:hypothetical protein